ncbi:MAG: Hsp33 family molecular chaperone HslO [Oscillospiraceae bacterium]
MEPNIYRAISEDGGVLMCAIDSTNIVREMEQVHHTSAVVSAGLGRLLTGAALMGSFLKNEEDSLTLRVNGGGPVGSLVAVSDGLGNVRGYAENPVTELDALRADGKLDVGTAVGTNGYLAVSRDTGLKEPYIGQVPLVSGEIAEDITSYYATSEQTPTVCALGVLVEKDLSICKAGGFLMQLLPGATEGEIARLEANIAKLPSITSMLQEGGTPQDMINIAMEGFNPNILDETYVEYRCHCSRGKSRDILFSLGKTELEEMLKEEPTVTVECHFCDEKYTFDLKELLAEN